ncbi:hypothetical protein L9Z73_18035 [Pseudomonas sp. TNT11]|uniref:Uncharacterized protein n=1 Tax=Pseudomonas emilianonis TaxID=2915812 RepID=A0ABT0EKM4_9PSED|nr:hypothetical protein [Pseudomonas emilianonis]MCK1786179.1 hypothetical protein [Pseudomonas emilianonis]
MEVSNADVGPESGSAAPQDDTYSGMATFLCSSKTNGRIDIAGVCEILAASEAFSFALNNRGRIYFKESGRLKSQMLDIETSITGLGMKVSGHSDFLDANPGDSNRYALSNALDLLLSDKKLFNAAFGFPAESARVFMRPIAIRSEGDEGYELIVPYIRVYVGGIISISLPTVLGFESATVRDVVYNEVNKSMRNIDSVLCERELHLACTECQISQMPLRERLAQRKEFEVMISSALNAPDQIEFADEKLTVYELVNTNQFTLTDLARNLLSVVARAVNLGVLRTRIHWLRRQYHDDSIGEYWHGKPIIYVSSHTRQKNSSAENWVTHRSLVNSVMTRVHLTEDITHTDLTHVDMRNFDDFNNFYSESVSLMLASAQVDPQIEKHDSYTFNNLVSDIQVLNEAAHFIQIFYSYASIGINRCKTAIDVARLELKVLKFEESLLSAHKYGEIAKYMGEVKKGYHLTTVYEILCKKIETVRKSLELDEKIASESYTRRITIIFGIIASATLSPELMQPLAKILGLTYGESIDKIIGIIASVVGVATFLLVVNYVFKSNKFIARMIGRD